MTVFICNDQNQDKEHDNFMSYQQRQIQGIHIGELQREMTTCASKQNAALANMEGRLRVLWDIKQNITQQFTIQDATWKRTRRDLENLSTHELDDR